MPELKIYAISDTHNRHNEVTIPPCDILIHAGDESFKGRKSEIRNFAKWLNKQPAKHVVWVPGNHSVEFSENYPNSLDWIKKECPRVHVLVHESVEIEGIKIFGSPWTPFFCNWAYNAGRTQLEANIRGIPFIGDLWKAIPDDTEILVTHGPPHKMLDLIISGTHQGCMELAGRIRSLAALKVHIFGHIHYSYGQKSFNGVHYYNVSICDESYMASNAVTEIL